MGIVRILILGWGGVIQFTGGAENKWRLFISFGVFDLSACNISSPP